MAPSATAKRQRTAKATDKKTPKKISAKKTTKKTSAKKTTKKTSAKKSTKKAAPKKAASKKVAAKKTSTKKAATKKKPVAKSRGVKRKAPSKKTSAPAAGKVSHSAIQGSAKDLVKVRRALISVSDKAELLALGKALQANRCEILSTGGTAKKMREAGLKVTDVDDHTGFPEILNGRVKTLHPLIHGGLLGVRGNKEHAKQMKQHNIKEIDMVVCNLYPFSETVAKGADFATCIENIDIGGPSMVRSASKNNAAVAILTDPCQYKEVIAQLKKNKGSLTFDLRKKLACEAFTRTASYDTAISKWFQKQIK